MATQNIPMDAGGNIIKRITDDGQEEFIPSSSRRWQELYGPGAESPETIADYVAPPTPVPDVVSARQARLALSAAGLLANVEAAIAASSEAVQITWEYANEIHRSDPLIASLGAALSMSDAEIDGLFQQAIAL